MTPQKNIIFNKKLLMILIFLVFAIATAIATDFFYISNREITDPKVLIEKTIAASKSMKSYQFNSSTNLTIQGEEAEVMSAEGYVDYSNKKIRTMMITASRSIEIVVIGDTAYMRESNSSWQTKELDEQSPWGNYDQMEQQYSILQNAANVSMHKKDTGWILYVFPDRSEVINQIRKTGLETVKEEELRNFTITYWIEEDSYHITRIENNIDFKMNIQGMVMPVRSNNFIDLHSYNEEIEIEAPVV